MLIRVGLRHGTLCVLCILVGSLVEMVATVGNRPRTQGNECAKGTLKCHADADCIDSVRSSRCRCKKGYSGDGRKCTDKNECLYKNGGCVHFCVNTKGNYTCGCRDGFKIHNDRKNCIDMNECFDDKGGCDHQCVNTLGGYECRCNQGYALQQNGYACKQGTWCQKNKGCEHHCLTTNKGTVVCACRDGYKLHPNERNCVQTCSVGNGGCQHNCTDVALGVQCSCALDYILLSDNVTCVATCMVNNGGCQKKCNDTRNGPVCSCPEGFQLHQDQKSCLDLDECSINNGGCSHECRNLEGSYECVCPNGYKVSSDRTACEDIDECELKSTCDHLCINTPGSHVCACNDGYDLYGESHCADRDECSFNNGGCHHTCINANGTFSCQCDKGFKLHLNNRDCVDENTCYELNTPPGGQMSCKQDGEDTVCVLKCTKKGRFMMKDDQSVMTTHCGPGTQYLWDHEMKNRTLPSCSAQIESPNLSKKVVFKFLSKRCRRRKSLRLQMTQNITSTLNAKKQFRCDNSCNYADVANFHCQSFRHKKQPAIRYMVTVELDLIRMAVTKLKKRCDVQCVLKKTDRKLKKVIKKLRKDIRGGQFFFSYAGDTYAIGSKTFKSPRGTKKLCGKNSMLLGDTCVGCPRGSFFNPKEKLCKLCLPGFYQEEDLQPVCKPCPDNPPGIGIYGASSLDECKVQCEAGFYSTNGLKPCKPCPVGSYQPEYGRLTCQSCGNNLTTAQTGSSDFKQCQTKETCKEGHFFHLEKNQCMPCARGFYQGQEGQNFCIRCPEGTTTDTKAARTQTECKSHVCGQVFKKKALQGLIESPNYPGSYPANVSCVWKIRPGKNRRILIIVPDMDLPITDKCGDKLVMRKSNFWKVMEGHEMLTSLSMFQKSVEREVSENEYSTVTYETCEESDRPIAFTARSKRLWVQFQSDGQNTAKGFSIPFVTYNAEYQRLIEDIVQDGRLYSSFQHQSVLKDRKVLNALMEVIAHPYSYFKYAKDSRAIIPPSFLKLLKKKVIRFFST